MSRTLLTLLFFLCCLPDSLFAQACPEKPYPQPDFSAASRQKLEAQLQEAWTDYARDSSSPDAMIWYGRRLAYLGRYAEAISVFSRGVQRFPDDARFLRHRGHRYITVRCNPAAIADFSRAASIEKGRPDQVEPDGMPNAQNTPTSTLQTNIYYHLGLAYYLEKDFSRAAEAWKACRELSRNPDMYMAAAYWEYISLRRAGQEQAARALLNGLDTKAQLIENEDYYALLMLYRGVLIEATVLEKLQPSAGGLSNATTGYALGVYYLLKGDRERSGALWKQVLEGRQWASFGYIASEAEYVGVR
jgi:tetratricopeptide (TPR) repeat protein